MFAITNTENSSYLKLARMPSGPTLSFFVDKYCLASDVFRDAEKKIPLTKEFNAVPIVILNGFSNHSIPSKYLESTKIAATMFQSIFPPINPNEFDPNKASKVVLFNLELNENGEPLFQIRHYQIEMNSAASKKTISNIINSKVTDFSKFGNIADYILKATGFTDASDNEGEKNEIELIEQSKVKTKEGEIEKTTEKKANIKLKEIGPRLDLKIMKIEEGFFKGNVAFHSLIQKSKKEILEKSKEIREKRLEKQRRREEQEANVKRKEEEKFNNLPEEKKEAIIKEKEEQDNLLRRKRRLEAQEQKKSEKEKVMTQKELKELRELKRGK